MHKPFAIALTPIKLKVLPVWLDEANTEQEARSMVMECLRTLRSGGSVAGYDQTTVYSVFAYFVKVDGKPGDLVISQRVRERPNPYAKPGAVSTFAVV